MRNTIMIQGIMQFGLCVLFLFCTGLEALAQELCDDGVDNDGNGLIDCFDPACCDDCLDHYFSTCIDGCRNVELKDTLVLRELWRFQGEWDNRNTPLVGRMSGDSVVVLGMSSRELNATSNVDVLLVNGHTGQLKGEIPTEALSQYGQSLGIADITGDGEGELVLGLSADASNSRHLAAYDMDGNQLWVSDARYGYGDEDVNFSPQFADFNEDGEVEIYIGNQIFEGNTGRLLAEGGSALAMGAQDARDPGYRFAAVVAADLLPDDDCVNCAGLELAAGSQVYAVDIASGQMEVVAEYDQLTERDGLTACADMNGDGQLEVVLTQRRGQNPHIVVWSPQSETLLSSFVHVPADINPFSGSPSPPLLTDLDGDGFVDIVFSTSMELIALRNAGGTSLEQLWTIETDDLSGRSGPVAFDFDRDGRSEVVYRGQEKLRVLNGESGEVLDEVDCFSPTYFDKVVVANVDEEPSAEIVCSCNGELRAYASGFSRWAATRPVWNQMNFYNVHIRDDLSVPRVMQEHQIPEINGRKVLNRSLEAFAMANNDLPDWDFENIEIICEDGDKSILFEVCNRGDVRAPVQTFIAGYGQDPLSETAAPLWNVQVPEFLEAGQCREYEFSYPFGSNVEEVYFTLNVLPGLPMVDTADASSFIEEECRYDNNLEYVDLRPYLFTEVDLGMDTVLCDPVDSLDLAPEGDFIFYNWSTTALDSAITLRQSGTYSVTVTDECGNQASDEILVEFRGGEPIPLPPDTAACLGDQVSFTLPLDWQEVVWEVNGDTACVNCSSLDLTVVEPATVNVQALKEGCSSTGSFQIDTLSAAFERDTVEICIGDSVLFDGAWVGEGTHTAQYESNLGCDSTFQLTVVARPEPGFSTSQATLCDEDSTALIRVEGLEAGDTVIWEDGAEGPERNVSAGQFRFTVRDAFGCSAEGTIEVEVEEVLPNAVNTADPTCHPDSTGRISVEIPNEGWEIFVNGNSVGTGDWLLEAVGEEEYVIEIDAGDCGWDTTLVFEEVVYDSIWSEVAYSVVLGDSVLLRPQGPEEVTNVQWSSAADLPCEMCPEVVVTPLADAVFILRAFTAEGCPVVQQHRVNVEEEVDMYLPNVFSPNSDGVNDDFVLTTSLPVRELLEFQVFNRWGELMVEGRGIGGSETIEIWDGSVNGRPAPAAVYVYRIRLIDALGRERSLTGSVTLLR